MSDELEPPIVVESAGRRWLRRLAPWVITVAAVTAILLKYPIGRIVEEMQRGNAWGMLPVALGATVALWFTATTSDYLFLRPLSPGLGFVRLMRGKAGVSVLNALGMALNYGGFALWITRALRCRWKTSVGVVLMITVGDLTAVAVVAVVALLLGGEALPVDMHDRLWSVAPVVAVFAGGFLLVPRGRSSARPVLEPWRRVPRHYRALSLVARCGTITVLIIATWGAARAFGLPVPLKAWASFLPVLLVIGAMPINIGGFGPVQAAWLMLFGPWASGPQILAFQFLWHLALITALFLRGAPFLRDVVADVAKPAPQPGGGQPVASAPSTK